MTTRWNTNIYYQCNKLALNETVSRLQISKGHLSLISIYSLILRRKHIKRPPIQIALGA